MSGNVDGGDDPCSNERYPMVPADLLGDEENRDYHQRCCHRNKDS